MSINGRSHTIILAAFAAFFVVTFGFAEFMHEADSDISHHVDERSDQPFIDEPIQPMPLPAQFNAQKVALGDMLFHEPRLSLDDSISCAHCHNLSVSGIDKLPRSIGINGKEGLVNAPTVFNAALHIAQFWDGKASTLEKQIDSPIHSPTEMDTNWPDIMTKLGKDPTYTTAFSEVYENGINSDNIKDAIATFERTLITLNAPFDRYLRGETSAITAEQEQGYLVFKEYGCASCHQGANVGGNMFQRFGIMRDYFADHPIENEADFGRFNVTGLEEDRHVFRIPSLRLVTLTAPYFHNGSAETLEEAVRIMARYQLGRAIPEHDIQLIIGFLDTLVGEYKSSPLQP